MPVEDLLANEIVQSALLLLFFLLLGSAVRFVLGTYAKKLAQKTKSDIDDIILGIVSRPLYYYILVWGAYLSLKALSFLSPYGPWIEGAFFISSVLLASFVFSRILSTLLMKWLSVSRRFEKAPRLLVKIIRVVIYLVASLMILGHFSIEITPLMATLGIGGLAIGLALQDTLSNFFSGLHIISDRPINVGDFIELEGDVKGFVEDIGWRSTKIKTLPNTIVIIPNSRLASSVIVNYSLPEPETACVVQCGVSYGSDLKKVERVTTEVAKEVQKSAPGAVKGFQPFIRYHTFGDSNIDFSIILRVQNPVDKYLVTHEFIKALKERYDKEGIEISWPVRKVYQAGVA